MGFLESVLKKNSELEFLFDLDLAQDQSEKVYYKRLAIETCINFLGRTISQSEFRIKNKDTAIFDELYYRLNVRPNKNMTASMFWQTVVHKLVYDNEVLIIQADDEDLLIVDDFKRNSYAVFEDTFSNVTVKDYEFKRTFKMSDVFYLQYDNEALIPLINSLFTDYGELISRLFSALKRRNQIRSKVKVDSTFGHTEDATNKLQNFINKIYKAFSTNDIAVVPEQRGLEYSEITQNQMNGPSVDEINKVTDGFLDKVAMAMGIPLGLLHGDMAEVENQTKNYMVFTVKPFLKKVQDEATDTFIGKEEFFDGKRIDIRKASYQNIFDLASAVDKLRSSGTMNGNEIRDELGLERVDDPIMDKYFITKNYQESADALKGGDNE